MGKAGPEEQAYDVASLEGPLLDLAVANVVGVPAVIYEVPNAVCPHLECSVLNNQGLFERKYMPSRDWLLGGPLIEQHQISLEFGYGEWQATRGRTQATGPTLLVAAMRLLVLTAHGPTIRM